jgi:hypothetical protein
MAVINEESDKSGAIKPGRREIRKEKAAEAVKGSYCS